MPAAHEVSMLCASGHRKTVNLTPMVIPKPLTSETLLVHLFQESEDGEHLEQTAKTVEQKLTAISIPAGGMEQLTPRELEILKLTALGMTPKEISEELYISYYTVRNHTTNLRRKLRATNNFGLVRSTQESGLL